MVRATFGMLGCAIVLATTLARADPESDAKDLFERGRDLRAHGDCSAATELFRRAVAVYPSGLGSLRNLAECEEALQHYAAARRAWLDLGRGVSLVHDAKYEGWEEDARSAADRLAPKIARVLIDVSVQSADGRTRSLSRGDTVDVFLDGEALDRALIGTELERDPGPHVLRVQGPSLVSGVSRHIDLRAGESLPVTLAVSLRGNHRAARASSPAAVSGWTLVGVGGAALVAASVSLVVRQDALGDLSRACPDYQTSPCSPSVMPTVSRGRLASTLIDVFAIGGLASLGGGVALVLVSATERSTSIRAGLYGVVVQESF